MRRLLRASVGHHDVDTPTVSAHCRSRHRHNPGGEEIQHAADIQRADAGADDIGRVIIGVPEAAAAIHELDMPWHLQNHEAINDHAEMFDLHKGFHRTTVTEVNGSKSELEEVKNTIAGNDKSMKEKLQANDDL